MNFKEAIKQPEYWFLRDSSRIRGTLCYLTVSGSYAYGTNNENSDLDIRGVAIEYRDDLLLGNRLEQYEDRANEWQRDRVKGKGKIAQCIYLHKRRII